MSIETWMQEFMPTSPDDFLSVKFSPETSLAAIQHAKQKWTGLRQANTKKHGLFWKHLTSGHWVIHDSWPKFHHFGGGDCALCTLYICNPEAPDNTCNSCPLGIVSYECNDEPSIWLKFCEAWSEELREAAVEDMITALTRAEAWQKERLIKEIGA